MSIENRNFYLNKNNELEGYDIMKRNSVQDGYQRKDEKVATVYSVDYIDAIIDALNISDMGGQG